MHKGRFTQAIFAAIFLLLMYAIKWIDLRPCHTRQFFLATCNANLGEKDISGSCRIVDICKLLYDLQSDYFAN